MKELEETEFEFLSYVEEMVDYHDDKEPVSYTHLPLLPQVSRM